MNQVKWLLISTLLISMQPSWAHHSNTRFDPTKNYIMHGTVEKMVWKSPHSWIYMHVTKADGSTELWGYEFGPPNTLTRAGWRADEVKKGDKVTVTGNIMKNGEHIGVLVKLVLSNGRELSATPEFGPHPAGERPVETINY